jgi:TonB-linked SusC/RagA family outer membrane protein
MRSALVLIAAFLALAVGFAPAEAQTGSVTGTVTGETSGEPIDGAVVQLVGTRLTALTDRNGRFLLLNVPVGTYTVTTEYLGYSPGRQEDVVVREGTPATVTITMHIRPLSIDALVVTGVSEATQAVKMPFTVGRVTTENIATVPTTSSALAAIQGKVAGVSVIRGSGLPGTGVSILLRSPTTIQTTNSPMFVVDGVVMASAIDGTTVDLESLDIESIEVVKGAAAASLYGSRAANGVIAITTRRGRDLEVGDTRITTRSEFGNSIAPEGISLLKTHPFLQNEQGQWVDAAGNVVPRNERVLHPDNMMTQPYMGKTYDAVNSFFRPAQFMQHSVNLSHRSQNTNFFLSGTQYREEGVMETLDGFTRNTFRMNLDHRLGRTFTLQASAQHTRFTRDLIYAGTGDTYWDLLMFPPDVDLGRKDSQGKFLQQPDSSILVQNPLWYEQSREYDQQRARTLVSMDGRFNPFQFFTLWGNVAYDRSDENIWAFTPKGTPTSLTAETEHTGYVRKDYTKGDVLNASLQANLTYFWRGFSMRTVGRALLEREKLDEFSARGNNLFVIDVPRLNVAADRTVTSWLQDVRSSGYFVEQNVDYQSRYVVTGLLRRDGSSLFGPDNRWHNYYRAGVSWLLSEESWWNIEPLSLFKLRYSRGTAGGRPGFSYQYEIWNVSNTGAVSKATLGNRNLAPSHTTEEEMGLDLTVNDRYSLQLTYAKQVTRDQIIQLALPAMIGYPNQWYNTGVQSGHTYEATLEAQVVSRQGFDWRATFVADRYRSTMDEWNRSCFISGLRNICEGASLSDMWGFRFLNNLDEIRARHPESANQFQVNDDGYVVWVGEGATYKQGLSDGLWGTSGMVDGENYQWGIPVQDRDEQGFAVLQQIGSSAPDFSVGWLNNIYWRGFMLHTHLHAQIGGNVYNATKQRLYQHQRSGDLDQSNKPEDLRKTIEYYQGVYNAMNYNSHFVEDGSFLKLRSLSLQYRLNQDQLNRLRLGQMARGMNLGLNARNILTLTKYTGFDPEVGSVTSRLDSFGYPNTRQLTLTAEIIF